MSEHALSYPGEVDCTLHLEHRLAQAATIIQHRLTTIFPLMTALGGTQPPNRSVDRRSGLINLAELFEPDRERLHVEPRTAAQLLWGLSPAANHPAPHLDTPLSPAELVACLLGGIRTPTPPS